ncbi:MAG: tRNA uridine-5-carboxymethylaminomethyl(34) synthesis GTPase MnmE [Bacteroidales bacterium]|nr:tRNA uridine-5-carboxymethylaminomethyl(34) synthesis GTPase MnmE [Bacteroidales bacterium]
MYTSNNDTICAIATAPGKGALSIIRISGKETYPVIDSIFRSKKNKNLINEKGYTLLFGSIFNEDKLIDEVLLSLFKAPLSYTGEDLIEISCHASPFIQQEVIKLLLHKGVRLAKPGEFTLRAYMNGRMDLSQAEAVSDLIASTSASAHQLALSQMRGGYANELKELRNKLLHFHAMLELELDFAEEEVEFADRTLMKTYCSDVQYRLVRLVGSFAWGNAVKHGIQVAIVGEPNVGKSTLLNALLNEDKAIVSDIPGTTRDVIEDVVQIDGYGFRFIDTAGIRNTSDTIEKLGIKKTFEKIEQAAIVLLLVEVSFSIQKIKADITQIKNKIGNTKPLFILVNKIDNLKTIEPENRFNTEQFPQLHEQDKFIFISARENKNIDILKNTLVEQVACVELNESHAVVTNARHHEALSHAKEAIERVNQGLESNLSNDLLALELRQVLHYVGEITGTISNDEMLGHIFKNFCIGK